jgi:hypothetical protein
MLCRNVSAKWGWEYSEAAQDEALARIWAMPCVCMCACVHGLGSMNTSHRSLYMHTGQPIHVSWQPLSSGASAFNTGLSYIKAYTQLHSEPQREPQHCISKEWLKLISSKINNSGWSKIFPCIRPHQCTCKLQTMRATRGKLIFSFFWHSGPTWARAA